MLFPSITFLYFFLPFTLFLYYFVPDKFRNLVLFAMSVLFYAWGEPVYVILMLIQISVSFVLTWLSDLFMNNYNYKRAGRVFYILSVLLPFFALFFYKFSDTLPIGISFYTFQITSYCIDVHYKRIKRQKNFVTYAAYVTLFPQLVAGPIVRYTDIEGTLLNGFDKEKIRENFNGGIIRFCIGLGKKVLIANVIGEFVAEAQGMEARTLILSWAYAAAVSLQIYFDFSGYSDMALGLGKMLGFNFPENFRYPFISKSISEFWRRWHITLGAWFRDYLYIPLGGNRVSPARWVFNILIVWIFTGLWHGAGWNFIVWGLYFAAFLIAEKLLKKYTAGLKGGLKNIYVVIVVMISFLIFSQDSLSAAGSDIISLFKNESLDSDLISECTFILKNRLGILIIGIIGATPLPKLIWNFVCEKVNAVNERLGIRLIRAVTVFYAFTLFILSTAYIIDGSFNPFLYFRF